MLALSLLHLCLWQISVIPTDQYQSIFARDVTSKENVRGFGLHYRANAMAQMNGAIAIQPTDQGTCFRLILPWTEITP